MRDTEPQVAAGKVLWHFTMSLDGFVAGPNHAMEWMTGFTARPGLIEEYVETTGAILGGRDGFDAFPDADTAYGGAWQGQEFVLTHHPDDAPPTERITFLDCDVTEARSHRPGCRRRQERRDLLADHRPAAAAPRISSTRSTCTSRRCCSATASVCSTTRAVRPSGSSSSPAMIRSPW